MLIIGAAVSPRWVTKPPGPVLNVLRPVVYLQTCRKSNKKYLYLFKLLHSVKGSRAEKRGPANYQDTESSTHTALKANHREGWIENIYIALWKDQHFMQPMFSALFASFFQMFLKGFASFQCVFVFKCVASWVVENSILLPCMSRVYCKNLNLDKRKCESQFFSFFVFLNFIKLWGHTHPAPTGRTVLSQGRLRKVRAEVLHSEWLSGLQGRKLSLLYRSAECSP